MRTETSKENRLEVNAGSEVVLTKGIVPIDVETSALLVVMVGQLQQQ